MESFPTAKHPFFHPFEPDAMFAPSIKYFWKKKNNNTTGNNTVTDIAIR